nr:M23 family metallopeptidase [Pelagibacterium limicola]
MDPFLKRTAFHAGIDFRAPTGTPILAAASGTVIHAGPNGGYGKMVDIDHGNGLVTRYAHMSSIGVHEGQVITGGERIGLAGSTGRSTGPHLHFEVRRNDTAIDPARFLAAGRALAKFL